MGTAADPFRTNTKHGPNGHDASSLSVHLSKRRPLDDLDDLSKRPDDARRIPLANLIRFERRSAIGLTLRPVGEVTANLVLGSTDSFGGGKIPVEQPIANSAPHCLQVNPAPRNNRRIYCAVCRAPG